MSQTGKNENSNHVENFLTALAVLIITTTGTIFRAFATTKLWLWFMVPTFHVQPLGMIMAMGLSVFAGHVGYSFTSNLARNVDSEETNESKLVTVTTHALVPLFTLLTGYVVMLCLPAVIEATK